VRSGLACILVLSTKNGFAIHEAALEIADFGLAKACNKEYKKNTNSVVTRWYRSPELLLGTTNYGSEIDIWALGCVFGELMMNGVLMPGRDDIHQLKLVWHLCGTPKTVGWRN